jgi:mono/diheme cytochrome c family protein
MKLLVAVGSLLLTASVAFCQDKPAPVDWKVPDNLISKTNPVKTTPEGLAHAKKTWGYDCAVCHGATGDGKGDIASTLKTPLKDLKDPATLQGMSDGEVFYIIQHGKGEMPPEGDRGKPDDLWNLVAFVRSLSAK